MSKILDEFGRPFATPSRAAVEASYDAAKLDGQNTNHWAASDALDADGANSLAVRRRISQRARYELSNNAHGRGVQLTHANYVCGRGPSLRMQTGNENFNRMIEARWKTWAAEVKLGRKLRTLVKAKVCDGESFAIIAQNPRMRHKVKLGLRLVECEQVTTPYMGVDEVNKIDGIKFDEFGNALHYDVLKYHPGGAWSGLQPEAEQVPARWMLHLFREDRPGQHRGVSEVSPSLNLFAQSRRYREATVAAAEGIANLTVLLKTQQSPDEGPDEVRPLSSLPTEKNVMMALPYGFDAFQPKAEQPSSTYNEFTRAQSCEQARPLNMPYNIAAADSSGYSFSGGKLDHVTYFVSVDVEQAEIEDAVLEPLFEVWFAEAVLRFGWTVPAEPAPSHTWDWPRKPVIDEAKTANARKTNLSTGAADFQSLAAEDGVDSEERIAAMATTYGVTVDEIRAILLRAHFGPAASAPEPEPDPDEDPDAEDDAEKNKPSPGRNRLPAASRNGNGKVRQ